MALFSVAEPVDTEVDDGFNYIDTLPLFEELSTAHSGLNIDPSPVFEGFPPAHGALKLGCDRPLVYYSGKESAFSVSVERILAVDGWEDEIKAQRTTLLVFRCEVVSTEKSLNVSSVKTWFDLEDDPATKEKNRAAPEIQAWGPFVEPTAWNSSVQNITTEKAAGGEVGADAFGATAKLNAEWRRMREGKKRFFDRGVTVKRWSEVDGRLNGIEWYVAQNDERKEGVPAFCFAFLFNRANDNPLVFNFGFKCHAGPWESVKGWFGRGKNIKKPYHYVPHPDTPRATRRDGKHLLTLVDQDRLGELYELGEDDEANLMKLTHVAMVRFIRAAED